MGREHHDLGLWLRSEDPSRGLDAVETGHPQVHQHDIRPVAGAQRDRLLAVGRSSDRMNPGRDLQQRHQPLADQGLVVDHEHAHVGVAHGAASARSAIPPGRAGWAGSASAGAAACGVVSGGRCNSTRQPSAWTRALTEPPSACARSRIPFSP